MRAPPVMLVLDSVAVVTMALLGAVGLAAGYFPARKEANLDHIRLHDLRHQFASHLVNSGRTLYEVQQILGHSDPSVTQRYAHLSTATLQDAADSANAYLEDALDKTGT